MEISSSAVCTLLCEKLNRERNAINENETKTRYFLLGFADHLNSLEEELMWLPAFEDGNNSAAHTLIAIGCYLFTSKRTAETFIKLYKTTTHGVLVK